MGLLPKGELGANLLEGDPGGTIALFSFVATRRFSEKSD